MENRLCNSFVANPCEKSKFFAFEIRTTREEVTFDGSTFMRLVKTISDFDKMKYHHAQTQSEPFTYCNVLHEL